MSVARSVSAHAFVLHSTTSDVSSVSRHSPAILESVYCPSASPAQIRSHSAYSFPHHAQLTARSGSWFWSAIAMILSIHCKTTGRRGNGALVRQASAQTETRLNHSAQGTRIEVEQATHAYTWGETAACEEGAHNVESPKKSCEQSFCQVTGDKTDTPESKRGRGRITYPHLLPLFCLLRRELRHKVCAVVRRVPKVEGQVLFVHPRLESGERLEACCKGAKMD